MSLKPFDPYPFPFSPHSLWVLCQLIETPRQWNLHNSRFFIETFSDAFSPSIENDFYACEILKYLESHKVVKIYHDDPENIKVYTLPIPGDKTHRMVSKWEVSVNDGDQSFIIRLHNKIAYHLKIQQLGKLDKLKCSFYISDGYLWINSELGDYPLRRFNNGLISHTVMSALCDSGRISLNEKHEIIYPTNYPGFKVTSLQETIRGIGFDKILKHSFFIKSTADELILKKMPLSISRSFMLHVVSHFEDVSKIRSHINSKNHPKRKIEIIDSLKLLLERDSNHL